MKNKIEIKCEDGNPNNAEIYLNDLKLNCVESIKFEMNVGKLVVAEFTVIGPNINITSDCFEFKCSDQCRIL